MSLIITDTKPYDDGLTKVSQQRHEWFYKPKKARMILQAKKGILDTKAKRGILDTKAKRGILDTKAKRGMFNHNDIGKLRNYTWPAVTRKN